MTLLAFALIHLIPGDPVENLSGERGMAPERRERLLHEYGLDRPLPVQYAVYIRQVLKGDLGSSLTTHEPVLDEFLTLFPATVELAFFAMLLAVCVGLPAGILAALKRNTVADYAVMGVSLTGYSMPIFWWALLLILFFSVHLGWTPVSGRIAVEFDVPAVDRTYADRHAAQRRPRRLPVGAVASHPAGDRAGDDSARGHRAHDALVDAGSAGRRLRAHRARQRAAADCGWSLVHALRNALIPVVTVIGLQVGLLLAGAILTETIFSWPGVGNWLIHGVQSRDYPVVQGGIC